jgi:SAM-dependent methyltransferase
MLANVNLEEYLEPDLYDLENPDFEPEGSFYLSIAKEIGGPVLELGCGTGRITIPLAQNGLEMTGLDVVPGMLALARAKADNLPIHWVEADVRNFNLGRKFKFIFESGSVFMHMLTNADQLAFLARVREHLAPEGRFVVCLQFPHPAGLCPNTEEEEWFTYQDRLGRTICVSGTEIYDELCQVRTETAIRHIVSSDGTEIVQVAPLQLRCTFPQELEALLDRTGFEVQERYGGPDRSSLTGDSRYMIFICGSKAA